MTYEADAKPKDDSYERMKAYVATLPSAPRRTPNIVYFILATETRRVKIGIAADPWYRLGNLQTGCPEKLIMLGGIFSDHARALERELHACYAAWRIHGEWFDMFDDLHEHIQEMCAEDKAAIWAMRAPIVDEEPRVTDRPTIPPGVPIPKGRGAKLARYKLARGIA